MLTVDLQHRQGAFSVSCAFSSAAVGVTALFGPSGSGKTSVVNMVAGLTRPDQGKILLDGRPLVDSAKGLCLPMEQRRIGYVFQDGRLFPHMTVAANLRYGMDLAPVAERSISFGDVVDMLGIEPLLDRRPAKLSGGEKQRVAIGRALLTSPRLLLMDEPLAALDSNRKQDVLPFIGRLPREVAIPILYVTHSMDEILRLADLLVLMDQGRSAAVGSVEDLLSRPDLQHLTGRYDPGAVVSAVVRGHEARYALTCLDIPAGPLVVPTLPLPVGQSVRVRILSRDVSLAAEKPIGLSVQNVYRGTVIALGLGDGPYVDVQLDCAGSMLMSRVSRKAAHEMGIEPGRSVYALVKAVSISREAIGSRETAPDV
jgi:molybdate transport system ATP-binding protein